MKPTKFTFLFKGGKISVYAFHEEEARILAQAEAINRGWDYKIVESPCPKCSFRYNGACCGCPEYREYLALKEKIESQEE